MMNDLEERLTNHLQAAGQTHSPSDAIGAIDAVKQTARRRSLRSRAAVGVFGLLAIAGAASLMPNNDNSSSLIVAADPTPVEQTEIQPDPAEPLTTQDEDIDTSEIREDAAMPPSHRIVGDGMGGFAAISTTTSSGRTTFVRSDDGRSWFKAGEVQFAEDQYMSDLRHVDGKFAAIVDMRKSGQFDGGYIAPRLAISADLNAWTLINFDFDDADPEMRYHVYDVALATDRVGVMLIPLRPTDFDELGIARDDRCGSSNTPNGNSITLCSGELVLVDNPGGPEFSPDVRYFESIDGLALVETPRDQPEPATIDAQHFDPYGSAIYGAGDLIGSTTLGTLDPEASERWIEDLEGDEPVEVLAIETNDNGEVLTLVRHGSRFAAVLQAAGQHQVSYLPESVSINLEATLLPELRVGPAGWAVVLNSGSSMWSGFSNDQWDIGAFVLADYYTIRSTDGTTAYTYSQTTGTQPPYVEKSLFGEIRLLVPGTDEVLIEISGDETRSSNAQTGQPWPNLPPTEAFDQQLVVDGWTLTGDMVRGPLTLTSPIGDTTVFADGFAFGNGDIGDGVEADALSRSIPSPLKSPRGQIRFFDSAGNETVAFDAGSMFDALVLPVIDLPTGDGDTTAIWLLHSPDGTTWRVLEDNNSSVVTRPSAAVGDDEVLLLDASGLTRFEIDE